jgi:hypothetical protein
MMLALFTSGQFEVDVASFFWQLDLCSLSQQMRIESRYDTNSIPKERERAFLPFLAGYGEYSNTNHKRYDIVI